MKNNIRNWNFLRITAFLLFLVCIIFTFSCRSWFYGKKIKYTVEYDSSEERGKLKNLDAETVLKQVFYPQDDILTCLYARIVKHGQTGSIIVTVYDKNGKEIASVTTDCSDLIEKGNQRFDFQVNVVAGAEYYYTITFEGVEDEYPVFRTAKCTEAGSLILGVLYMNDVIQEQSIITTFKYQESYTGNAFWRLCLILALLTLLFVFFEPFIPKRETNLFPLFIPFHALLSFFLLEYIVGHYIWELDAKTILLNVVLCSYIFIALSVLFLWKGRLVLYGGTVICTILGIAEYYVLKFRGTPLVLYDLLSVGTAADVADSYTFDITERMVVAVLILAVLFLWEGKICFRRCRPRVYAGMLGGLLLFGAGSFFIIRSMPLTAEASAARNGGIFWSLKSTYKKNGYFLGTYLYQCFQVVDKPDNYSGDLVREAAGILEETGDMDETSQEETLSEEEYPNIIAIMNESWTDFNGVGGIETTEPVTPFIDALEENTIKGNLYVSVYAGGTANTEFEFLTGSTMNFLPSGSIPFQIYIHDETSSLATYLKSLGYSTTALHLSKATNYNRDEAYPLLGFDEFISESDVEDAEIIRTRASDRATYQIIEECYENWKEEQESEHFFLFDVTIQNHGGYSYGYTSEIANPLLSDLDTDESTAEYLALLRESDQAFQELIEYFEQQEEHVIILMFGDHWPLMSDATYDYLMNKISDKSDQEQLQAQYTTSFIIWANYDIEEAEIEKLSANYLSALLLDTAELPLNGYQTFLSELMELLPVINVNGCIDADENYYWSIDELDDETANMAETYKLLQYGHLFGSLSDLADFFG
ncbi:MAG: sulfatase-like hydrolase/transferase [Lachnospiraceae bacterium]|nr:sulfatase-like hydrolase/transferase [Lachnospiraceae bacterium]